MNCRCGRTIPEALGTLQPNARGAAAFHCPCGLVYSLTIDVPRLHQRVLNLEIEVERLTTQVRGLTAHLGREVDKSEPTLKRWGIWVFDYKFASVVGCVEPAHWLQGAGVPGAAYKQGTEAEMRAEANRINADSKLVCEARELPPERAAMRYEGGP